jgi:sec-independent protein translocase protein TatA
MNIVSSLFNLGGPDMIIILLIVLLLFGAKRLPELARGLGQAMNEFTKAKDDMHRQIAQADAPPVIRPRDLQEHRPQEGASAPLSTPVPEAQASTPPTEDKPQV